MRGLWENRFLRGLAPEEEQEECDREEERDAEERARRRERVLEREQHDRERDESDEREAAQEPVLPEPPHEVPVMNARIASAPATPVVAANQSRRRGPDSGA